MPMIIANGTRISIAFLNMKPWIVAAQPSLEVISGASRLDLIGCIDLSIAISNLSVGHLTTCIIISFVLFDKLDSHV